MAARLADHYDPQRCRLEPVDVPGAGHRQRGATLTNVNALALTRSGRLGLVEARGLEEVQPGGDVGVPE